jgi:putative thiamine transport system permease protein
VILPQAYPLIRLPVFAVLAFALSVVDMAVILGPSNPPTLAVTVTRLAFAPDTAMLLPAAAAALLLAGIAGGGIALWSGPSGWSPRRGAGGSAAAGAGSAEPGLRRQPPWSSGSSRRSARSRWRRWRSGPSPGAGAGPHALPESWSARAWSRHGQGRPRRRR